jgi:hypothetical protein
MGLADEIRELKELRDSGILSEAEFEQAKAALLAGTPDRRDRPVSSFWRAESAIGDAAKSWVKLQVVMAIIGVVITLILFFGFFLPNWNKSQADFDRRWNEFPRALPSGMGK